MWINRKSGMKKNARRNISFIHCSRQLPEKRACLFVNHMSTPFAFIRYTRSLQQYDNKIIECSYRNQQWHFHRERTDKSFPNAKGNSIVIIFRTYFTNFCCF